MRQDLISEYTTSGITESIAITKTTEPPRTVEHREKRNDFCPVINIDQPSILKPSMLSYLKPITVPFSVSSVLSVVNLFIFLIE